MITLNYIKDIVEAYVHELQNLNSDDKATWDQGVHQAREKFFDCMRTMCAIYPELLQVNMPDFMDEEDLKQLGDRLRANSSRRFSLDYLATANRLTDIVNGASIETPAYIPW